MRLFERLMHEGKAQELDKILSIKTEWKNAGDNSISLSDIQGTASEIINEINGPVVLKNESGFSITCYIPDYMDYKFCYGDYGEFKNLVVFLPDLITELEETAESFEELMSKDNVIKWFIALSRIDDSVIEEWIIEDGKNAYAY